MCIFANSNFGAVAQSVEQRTENPCVGGSIPPHTTKLPKRQLFFMYYIYILYSTKLQGYYIGETMDINARIEQHNAGFYKNAYTSKSDDWELKYKNTVGTREEARKMERYIKSMCLSSVTKFSLYI